MKKNYLLLLIILCFLWRGCAFGASATTQASPSPQISQPVQAIDNDFKNIKPISALSTSNSAKTNTKTATTPHAKTSVLSQQQTAMPYHAKTNAPSQQTTETHLPPAQPQPIDFGICSRFFKLDSHKLFYLTLAGVNANRFEIKEIQSKSGYILFSVGQKQFLASVIKVDSKNSMLKITPCNNIYYFPVGIVQNMFKYIELNVDTPVERLSVL